MKRTAFLAIAAALFMGQSALAQAQEVTYVEDPSQGYLVNQFKDNWFITVEGGANVTFSDFDADRDFTKRIAPAASIYVGKYFSPIIGLRAGASWLQQTGVTPSPYALGAYQDWTCNGNFIQRNQLVGAAADVMLNLTNWWCGYKADRVYNAVFYAGAALYYDWAPNYDAAGARDGWAQMGHGQFLPRFGLINNFRLSDCVNLFLDLRYTGISRTLTGDSYGSNIGAFLGLSFNVGKSTWAAPIVPVCPAPENCDALRARLAAADARIADLETQLRECINRPTDATVVVDAAPLATIYYPINVYRLTRQDVRILEAVSEVMKSNPDKTYTVTGWADNYTGTEAYNIQLRKNRAAGVEKQLRKFGVPAAQITATINNGSLSDLGEKYVALDRAVTINEN